MLKFKNRESSTGEEFEYRISMTSIQGGIQVDVEEIGRGPKANRERTVVLTPMDAAAFAHDTRVTTGLSCRDVGHGVSGGAEGSTLWVRKLGGGVNNVEFIGDVAEVVLSIGRINMVVPTFVVDAMRLCVERMFESLMFPSTGDMEEEFG